MSDRSLGLDHIKLCHSSPIATQIKVFQIHCIYSVQQCTMMLEIIVLSVFTRVALPSYIRTTRVRQGQNYSARGLVDDEQDIGKRF